MDIQELFKDKSDEELSAFAYNTGRMIDEAIKVKSNEAINKLKELQSKVLEFRQKFYINSTMIIDYDKHFGIGLD